MKDSVIAQINIHLMWANWHIVSTMNGVSISRKMQGGDKDSSTGWRDLTDNEKIKESMSCAESHLHSASDLQNHLIQLENKEI
jgi:hypothetical protein